MVIYWFRSILSFVIERRRLHESRSALVAEEVLKGLVNFVVAEVFSFVEDVVFHHLVFLECLGLLSYERDVGCGGMRCHWTLVVEREQAKVGGLGLISLYEDSSYYLMSLHGSMWSFRIHFRVNHV